MTCPNCGKENPDNAQVCIWCSQTLSNETSSEKRPKVSVRYLILHSLVFGLIVLTLVVLCVVSTLASYITVLLIIIYSVNRTIRIVRNERLKGKVYVAVTTLVLFNILLVFFILRNLDAPPIPNDYTIADLNSAGTEYSDSYVILLSLADNTTEATGIGLSRNDVDKIDEIWNILIEELKNTDSVVSEVIKSQSEIINEIWEKAKKGRDIIEKLSEYEEISDLTQPDGYYEIDFLRNFRRLAKLYNLHVRLQSEQGNAQIAVGELMKFDSVVRKLSVNARSIITKMVCYSLLNMNIRTANFVVNNPNTSQDILELLAQYFVPFSNEQVSLRTSFIFEYLYVTKWSREELVNEFPILHFMRNVPFLKWNSTVRVCRNFFDEQLENIGESRGSNNEPLSVWPKIYPDLGPVEIDKYGEFPRHYKFYNPVGTLILSIMLPYWPGVFERKTSLEVQNDLFQIILNKRLGKQFSLKARAYNDEYIIDLNKKIIFSPGPDGQAYTEDDIRLLINPAVIEF